MRRTLTAAVRSRPRERLPARAAAIRNAGLRGTGRATTKEIQAVCPTEETPAMTSPPPTDAADYVSPRHQPMSFAEFVMLMATVMALTSLATSMMLAVLAEIGKTFGVDVTSTQSVLTAFFVGFSVGQFVVGPISDRFGRRAGAARRSRALSGRLGAVRGLAELRDAAGRTLPAGAGRRGAARHHHLGGARLLQRPADGERDVARDDGADGDPGDRADASARSSCSPRPGAGSSSS